MSNKKVKRNIMIDSHLFIRAKRRNAVSYTRDVYTNGIVNFYIRHAYFPKYHAKLYKFSERLIPVNYIVFVRLLFPSHK